jgi:hypothetical protein
MNHFLIHHLMPYLHAKNIQINLYLIWIKSNKPVFHTIVQYAMVVQTNEYSIDFSFQWVNRMRYWWMNFKLKIQIYIERNLLDNYLDGSVWLILVREICGEPTASRPSRRSLLLRRSTDFGGHGRLGDG